MENGGQKTRLAGLADKVARRFMDKAEVWGNYTVDLGLEALLRLSRATGSAECRDYVWQIIRRRNWTPAAEVPYKNQPFSCLTFELFLDGKDRDWLACFMRETDKCRAETPRSSEGAILHPCGKLNAGGALLIGVLDSGRLAVAERAFAALPRYVGPDGQVLNACPGPGTLIGEEGYLSVPEFPPDNPHGTFAMLFACIGDILTRRRDNSH